MVNFFECDQFDEICDIVGIHLRNKDRYGFTKSSKRNAAFQNFRNYILFEFPWFLNLSEEEKVAVFLHELKHRQIRNRFFLILAPAALLGFFFIFSPYFFTYYKINNSLSNLIRSPFTFWVYLIIVVFGYLLPLLRKIEYECDSFSIRKIGAEPFIKFLNQLPQSNKIELLDTHPLVTNRIRNAILKGKEFGLPDIDYADLSRRIPQSIQIRTGKT